MSLFEAVLLNPNESLHVEFLERLFDIYRRLTSRSYKSLEDCLEGAYKIRSDILVENFASKAFRLEGTKNLLLEAGIELFNERRNAEYRYGDLYDTARKLIQANTEILETDEEGTLTVRSIIPAVPSFKHLTTYMDKNGDMATGFTHFYLDKCLSIEFEESSAESKDKKHVIEKLIEIDYEMSKKTESIDKANFFARMIYSCCFKAPFWSCISTIMEHRLTQGLDTRTKFEKILAYQSHDDSTCLNVLFDMVAKVRNKYDDEPKQKSSDEIMKIATHFIEKGDQYCGSTTVSKFLVKGLSLNDFQVQYVEFSKAMQINSLIRIAC